MEQVAETGRNIKHKFLGVGWCGKDESRGNKAGERG